MSRGMPCLEKKQLTKHKYTFYNKDCTYKSSVYTIVLLVASPLTSEERRVVKYSLKPSQDFAKLPQNVER